MARGSNQREGRAARSELGTQDRRDLDGEPRASGRISRKEAPLRPYTEAELKRELKAYPNETRESLVGARNFLIRKEQEKQDRFKRLNDGKPNKADFDSGVQEPFFGRGGYNTDLLKVGAFIKMKNGDVFEVKEPLQSRKSKRGEEGWDGSDRSLYVQDLGGGNAQEYRIDDLTSIDSVIPRDWQKRLEGR